MKDILKIMRFDYLTAKPYAALEMIFVIVLFGILAMLFSPIIAVYITFAAMVFVIPLQGVADKNGFNKLYGILPVKRSSITMARFLYIFLVHFVTELIEAVLIITAKSVRLFRILPNQNGEMMEMVKDSFADTPLTLYMLFGIFAFFCLMFTYMEMMGQIHGRENEFKILMITVLVLTVLAFGYMTLSSHDILPMMRFPDVPEKPGKIIALGAVLNLVMLGLSLVFGWITTRKLAKREL